MRVPPPDVVILDTSVVLLPFEKGLDVQKEAERLLPGARLIVPSPVVNELAYLAAEGKGASRRNAKAALAYVVRFDEYKIGGKGDDAIIQACRRLEQEGFRIALATADQAMRFRARGKGWPVLTIRGHRAFLDGYAE